MDHINVPKLTPAGPPLREPPEIRKYLDEVAGSIEHWLKTHPSMFPPFSLHLGSPDPDYMPPIRLTDYDSGEVIAIPPSIIREVRQLECSRDGGVAFQARSRIAGPGACLWIVRESAQTINEQISFHKRRQEKAKLIDTKICPPVELTADQSKRAVYSSPKHRAAARWIDRASRITGVQIDHEPIIHELVKIMEEEVPEPPKPEPPSYQCDYCPAKWWTAGQLAEHIKKSHADRV